MTNGDYDLSSDVISPLDAGDITARLNPLNSEADAGSEVTLSGCHGCVSKKKRLQLSNRTNPYFLEFKL